MSTICTILIVDDEIPGPAGTPVRPDEAEPVSIRHIQCCLDPGMSCTVN